MALKNYVAPEPGELAHELAFVRAWYDAGQKARELAETARRARLQAILANGIDPHQRCQTWSLSGSLNRRASRA